MNPEWINIFTLILLLPNLILIYINAIKVKNQNKKAKVTSDFAVSFIRYLTDKFLHYDQTSLQLPLVFFTPSHSQLYFFFIMYCFVINNALNPASSFSIWLWSHPLEHEQPISCTFAKKMGFLPSVAISCQ